MQQISDIAPAAIFSFATNNLGDDLQSYAALLHLPRVAAFIDRDRLDVSNLHEPHLALLNSWFKLNPPYGNKGSALYKTSRLIGKFRYGVPDRSIDPIAFGFYLGNPTILKNGWGKYLAEIGPIGCRNSYTASLLAAQKIDTYITGCISMYFGRMFKKPQKREGVVFIDIDPRTEKNFIPFELSRRATRISNFVAPSIISDPWLRFAAVARLVETLRTAELVVSRRLHGSLPCVGLGTQVIALPDPTVGAARNRAQGFEGIMQIIYQDEIEKAKNVEWSRTNIPKIPDALERNYLELCEKLKRRAAYEPRTYSRAFGKELVRIRNPGLGSRPRQLYFKMGHNVSERRVSNWTSQIIELDFPYFAGLENLDAAVLCKVHGSATEPVGSLPMLLMPEQL